MLNRILVTCIRNLGTCPCPRCLIPLNEVHNLGTELDRERRTTMARVDDSESRGRVVTARKLIYDPKQNVGVDNKAIEDLLKCTSQVPTIVSVPISYLVGRNLV
jgi:hypothetical protein